jgi:hypothetical protein
MCLITDSMNLARASPGAFNLGNAVVISSPDTSIRSWWCAGVFFSGKILNAEFTENTEIAERNLAKSGPVF